MMVMMMVMMMMVVVLDKLVLVLNKIERSNLWLMENTKDRRQNTL